MLFSHQGGEVKRALLLVIIHCLLLGSLARSNESASAQVPERQTTIVVNYNEYEWWLIRWNDNEILCRVLVDHEGLPSGDEVFNYCGEDLFTQWESTPPCTFAADGKKSTTDCDGLYLHMISFQPKEREVVVSLPPAEAFVTLDGCTLAPPDNRCDQIPSLLITGEEPLPNEQITSIEGFFDGNPFSCQAITCTLQLAPTTLDGVIVEFWANSSYGDSSERYTAKVRVIDTGVSDTPGASGWYVDVISSQWRGVEIPSCARLWGAFPPLGEPPAWLSTPDSSELLASGSPFYYLAGRLIVQGVVDAKDCPGGGMLPNGYADACGLEKARPIVENWQNQFDKRILEIANESGIPAQLMKNLFAQESQFWPGIFRVPFEYGLGQITEKGVDSILLWNSSFFDQFCPLVLAEDACSGGYLHLNSDEQALLRGALALQAKSDCASCPAGIDLTNVDFSLSLFAKTLQANCAQVGEVVKTATDSVPGSVSSYEDLWRYTVANYHAGPGCVAYAINSAWQSGNVLTWERVSEQFTDACRGVVPYVDKITK
jgi:hypothetical protein